MKWVEIITLRSAANIDTLLADELLKGISESDSATDTPEHLVEIRVYRHSIVETDLSIHIYWESESGSQDKSPLGLRFSSALRDLGLLNHSVWVETAALEFPLSHGNTRSRDILESEMPLLPAPRHSIEHSRGHGPPATEQDQPRWRRPQDEEY